MWDAVGRVTTVEPRTQMTAAPKEEYGVGDNLLDDDDDDDDAYYHTANQDPDGVESPEQPSQYWRIAGGYWADLLTPAEIEHLVVVLRFHDPQKPNDIILIIANNRQHNRQHNRQPVSQECQPGIMTRVASEFNIHVYFASELPSCRWRNEVERKLLPNARDSAERLQADFTKRESNISIRELDAHNGARERTCR
jgi:hypothetical protein